MSGINTASFAQSAGATVSAYAHQAAHTIGQNAKAFGTWFTTTIPPIANKVSVSVQDFFKAIGKGIETVAKAIAHAVVIVAKTIGKGAKEAGAWCAKTIPPLAEKAFLLAQRFFKEAARLAMVAGKKVVSVISHYSIKAGRATAQGARYVGNWLAKTVPAVAHQINQLIGHLFQKLGTIHPFFNTELGRIGVFAAAALTVVGATVLAVFAIHHFCRSEEENDFDDEIRSDYKNGPWNKLGNESKTKADYSSLFNNNEKKNSLQFRSSGSGSEPEESLK